jgi:AraC-like DNA-binding protein
MQLMGRLQKKKYLTRIYVWVTLLIIIAIVTLTTLIFMNVESSVLNKEYQSNQMVLSQMKFNIDFMDEMIRNICISTYYRSDVQALMNESGSPTYEDMSTINQLNSSIVQTNPYVLSIYVYNNRNKVYYSTFNSFIYDDVDLDRLIASYDKVPVLRPIVRKTMTYHVGDRVEYSNVITYVMYELTDSHNKMSGAVIANIKLDWLLDNIRAIDTANQSNQSQVFILDDKGEFFDSGSARANENQQFRIALKTAYQIHSGRSGAKGDDFFRAQLGGTDYLVSYIQMNDSNWSILIVQRYDKVISYIDSLKTTILLIAGIILTLILVAAYSISRGLYKPVENLIRQVRGEEPETVPAGTVGDEFAYLNEAYRSSKDLLERYHSEKSDNIVAIKLYFLRKLLTNSAAVSEDEFERARTEYGVGLEPKGPFCVVTTKLDNESALQDRFDSETRNALKSAVGRELSREFSRQFRHETVEMEGNEVVSIANAGALDAESSVRVSNMLIRARTELKASYGVSFSAALCDYPGDFKGIAETYFQAANYLKYRFVLGPASVILPEMLRKNISARQFDYSYKFEKQLVEDLRSNDLDGVSASLDNIIDEVRGLDFNDIKFSLAHLVHIVRNVVYELNSYRKEPVNINALLSGIDTTDCETITEFRDRLLDALRFVVNTYQGEQRTGGKEVQLAEAIRTMIDTGYRDHNLSVSDLADKARMSSAKISKAFKENVNMSIPEYINEVRLKKAAEWIENSNLPISEIMRKIGIENESYFYRIFKARYDATPREYATNKIFRPS